MTFRLLELSFRSWLDLGLRHLSGLSDRGSWLVFAKCFWLLLVLHRGLNIRQLLHCGLFLDMPGQHSVLKLPINILCTFRCHNFFFLWHLLQHARTGIFYLGSHVWGMLRVILTFVRDIPFELSKQSVELSLAHLLGWSWPSYLGWRPLLLTLWVWTRKFLVHGVLDGLFVERIEWVHCLVLVWKSCILIV